MPISLGSAVAAIAVGLLAHQEPAKEPVQDPLPTPTPENPSYFNPQMAIVFDVRGRFADPDPDNRHVRIEEVEFGFAADVDPYLKAQAFLSVASEDGETKVEIEEAFAQAANIGTRMDLRVGKLKAAIGRTNRNHADQLEYNDLPFVLQDFLGEEGLSAPGASLAYLFPGDRFNELSLDILDPEEDGPLFSGARLDNPLFVGHYRTFFDFSNDTSAQLGFTYANGPGGTDRGQMYGADFTMKWQPGMHGKFWMLEAEAYGGSSGAITDGAAGDNVFGAFAAFTYEFRPRFFATIKADYSEIPGTSDSRKGFSLGLTMKRTEFSLLRLEYQRITSTFEAAKDLLTLKLQYLIGVHPAHKY
jgi:hypothetical protein